MTNAGIASGLSLQTTGKTYEASAATTQSSVGKITNTLRNNKHMIEYKKFIKNNKFTLAFCIVIVSLCLCSFKYYDKTPDPGATSGLRVTEIKMNGHFYVVATKYATNGGVSIIHSPNCNCNRR